MIILTIFLGFATGAIATEITSENHYKLKAVYEALPKTDGNHDGILTLVELREYVERKFNDRATSRSNFYLSKFLKNEPEADKNHDGVLTKPELLLHLQEPS
ncbi:MAG: hypothetical protein P1U89_13445 [Verrucomicrobiales bacterium]|nr:hypothetical protein [Verrucomicrobiales bacterium]